MEKFLVLASHFSINHTLVLIFENEISVESVQMILKLAIWNIL